MKVSVIIPAYNEGKYLGNCLRSLQNQAEKPSEVIVIDNNCTDSTVKIAKKFNAQIVKEKSQGIAYARSKGFNSAEYEIIARCDADAVVPTDWIQKIKQNFTGDKIDALTGPAYFYDFPFNTSFYFIAVFDFVNLVLGGKETLNGPNMAITKKIWHKIKSTVCLDDTKVHEDLDLALHIHKEGGIIKRDNSLVVGVSARRMKNNPLSAFGEYPVRGIKTLFNHKKHPRIGSLVPRLIDGHPRPPGSQ